MKKTILVFILLMLFVSCGLPAGGNQAVIKMDEKTVRYSDTNAPKPTYSEKVVTDSASAKKVNEILPTKSTEQTTQK